MTRRDYKSRGRSVQTHDTEPPSPGDPLDDLTGPALDRQIEHVIEQAVNGKPPSLAELAREVAADRPPPDRPTVDVWFRGERVTIHADDPLNAIVLCLLALEDERVDAILHALAAVKDAYGEIIWPPKPRGPS